MIQKSDEPQAAQAQAASRKTPSRSAAAWLAAVTILGALLRLYRINEQSLWFDESWTVLLSKQSIAGILRGAVAEFNTPPLHDLILHFWNGWLGHATLSSRWLAALFGVAALPAFYLFGREAYDRRTALVAVTLLASSQMGVMYSQEARAYSQYLFLSLTSAYFCLSSVRKQSRVAWCACVGSLVLLMYTHVYGVLVAIALALWLWELSRRGRFPDRWLLAGFVVGALGFAPWLASGVLKRVAVNTLARDKQLPWFSTSWFTPIDTLARFGNARTNGLVSNSPAWSVFASALLFSGAALVGLEQSASIRRLGTRTCVILGVVCLAAGAASGSLKGGVLLALLISSLPTATAEQAGPKRWLWYCCLSASVALALFRSAPLWIAFVEGLLCAVTLSRIGRARSHSVSDARTRPEYAVTLLAATPLVVPIAIGAMGMQFDPRYSLAALPSFYLLVSAGLLSLQPRELTYAAYALAIAFSVYALRANYWIPYKANNRDALKLLRQEYRSDECVVFWPPYKPWRTDAPDWSIPPEWSLYGYGTSGPPLRVVTQQQLESISPPSCRAIWLVAQSRTDRPQFREIEAVLSASRKAEKVRAFHWVWVTRYEQKS